MALCAIEEGYIYTSEREGEDVRVTWVGDGWVEYRRCDPDGTFQPRTRTATTRDTAFARRFNLAQGPADVLAERLAEGTKP